MCIHTGGRACISHKRVLPWPQAGVSDWRNLESMLTLQCPECEVRSEKK